MNWKTLVAAVLLPTYASAQTAAISKVSIPVPQLSLSYVAPPLVAVPEGDDHIVALGAGQPAPFSGQLYDPATAMRWAHYLQQAKLRLVEDVVAERKACNAQLFFVGQKAELEKEHSAVVEADLRARVLKLEQRNIELGEEISDPGFFRSPTFWFGTGVLTTGAIVVLGVLVAGRVN